MVEPGTPVGSGAQGGTLVTTNVPGQTEEVFASFEDPIVIKSFRARTSGRKVRPKPTFRETVEKRSIADPAQRQIKPAFIPQQKSAQSEQLSSPYPTTYNQLKGAILSEESNKITSDFEKLSYEEAKARAEAGERGFTLQGDKVFFSTKPFESEILGRTETRLKQVPFSERTILFREGVRRGEYGYREDFFRGMSSNPLMDIGKPPKNLAESAGRVINVPRIAAELSFFQSIGSVGGVSAGEVLRPPTGTFRGNVVDVKINKNPTLQIGEFTDDFSRIRGGQATVKTSEGNLISGTGTLEQEVFVVPKNTKTGLLDVPKSVEVTPYVQTGRGAKLGTTEDFAFGNFRTGSRGQLKGTDVVRTSRTTNAIVETTTGDSLVVNADKSFFKVSRPKNTVIRDVVGGDFRPKSVAGTVNDFRITGTKSTALSKNLGGDQALSIANRRSLRFESLNTNTDFKKFFGSGKTGFPTRSSLPGSKGQLTIFKQPKLFSETTPSAETSPFLGGPGAFELQKTQTSFYRFSPTFSGGSFKTDVTNVGVLNVKSPRPPEFGGGLKPQTNFKFLDFDKDITNTNLQKGRSRNNFGSVQGDFVSPRIDVSPRVIPRTRTRIEETQRGGEELVLDFKQVDKTPDVNLPRLTNFGGRGFRFAAPLAIPSIGGGVRTGRAKPKSRRFARRPSLAAFELGIFSNKPVFGETTGLVVRPLIKKRKRRRKR